MKSLLLSLLLGLTLITSAATPAPKPNLDSVEGTTKRAEKITYPRVEFRESNASECVEFLNQTSKKIDVEKIGVQLELTPAALAAAKETKITLSLNNVPLLEVVKYVTNLANLKYKVAASKIVVMALDEK
jgi:general secretion pathway protein D